MTGVTGKIEGAKVADGGGRRGPWNHSAWGEVKKVFFSLDSLPPSMFRGYPSPRI